MQENHEHDFTILTASRLADAAAINGHEYDAAKNLKRIKRITYRLREDLPLTVEDVDALEARRSKILQNLERRSGFFPKRNRESIKEVISAFPKTIVERNQDIWEKKGIQFTENFDTLYQ